MSCTQMAVTTVVVTETVHMSKRWKADLVAYGIRIQTSPRFMDLLPLKPNHSSICLVCPGSYQHPVLTSKFHSYQTVHQNRSNDNQQKAEFVIDNFGIQSFWGGHGKISSKS
jgi:hypothetical protein